MPKRVMVNNGKRVPMRSVPTPMFLWRVGGALLSRLIISLRFPRWRSPGMQMTLAWSSAGTGSLQRIFGFREFPARQKKKTNLSFFEFFLSFFGFGAWAVIL